MEPDFWLEHWATNNIGFHRPEPNPLLTQHWAAMNIELGERVFVPLCGKSLDMAWLAGAGHGIVGVELSAKAIGDFFAEQDLPAESSMVDGFLQLNATRITLLSGDFFDLTAAHIQPVGAVYDRAALIALPPDMRKRYAAQLAEIAPAPMLLVTADYDQSEMSGPPFAVSNSEVRSLYEDRYQLQILEGPINIMDQEPRFAERGVTRLESTIFRLLPR